MGKRFIKFPLVYYPKLGANFIRGEKYSKEELVALKKEIDSYQKYVALFNRGKLKSEKPIDTSFCKLLPMPHQELPIKLLLHFCRGYLLGQVGTGKTYMAGYVSIKRLHENTVNKCLILVPKVAISQWKRELIKFFEFPEDWVDNRLVITNYESLYYHASPEETPIEEIIKPEYKGFDMVILDEAHLVKNGYTVRAAVVAEILKEAKYRIAMTGTPIRNNPIDLFFQLSLINPWAFKCSYWQFLKEFFIEIKNVKFTKYKLRPHKMHEITNIIERNTIKVFKEDNSSRKVTFNYHKILPSNTQKAKVEEVARVVVRKADNIFELKNELMKFQQISSGFLKYSENYIERFESPKINNAIKRIVELVKIGKKVVVFAKFHETINRMLEVLANNGVEVVTLTGKLTKAKEEKVKQSFINGSAQVIIIQIQKGELALNLQVAHHVVFVEYDWSPASIEQAIGRVNRTGQVNDVVIDFFVTRGLVDDIIVTAVKNKNKINSQILRRYLGNVLAKL